jgi:hypothetical protein
MEHPASLSEMSVTEMDTTQASGNASFGNRKKRIKHCRRSKVPVRMAITRRDSNLNTICMNLDLVRREKDGRLSVLRNGNAILKNNKNLGLAYKPTRAIMFQPKFLPVKSHLVNIDVLIILMK